MPWLLLTALSALAAPPLLERPLDLDPMKTDPRWAMTNGGAPFASKTHAVPFHRPLSEGWFIRWHVWGCGDVVVARPAYGHYEDPDPYLVGLSLRAGDSASGTPCAELPLQGGVSLGMPRAALLAALGPGAVDEGGWITLRDEARVAAFRIEAGITQQVHYAWLNEPLTDARVEALLARWAAWSPTL